MIHTETGRRKKVILYNISIYDLLNHYDMLEKVKDVLDFFRENTDVTLWWRPHPLYEFTLASVRPDKLEEYQAMVRSYKEEAWGIFDGGVDLEWAIAETDAYYGDGSSVVQLYQKVEKPVMYQDVSVRRREEIKAEDIPVWPSAFCVDGDDIWFVHGKMNVLMRYDMPGNEISVAGRIPDEEMFRECAYSGMHIYKDKIFMIPSWAREIAVYNTSSKKFEKIPVADVQEYKGKGLFIKSYAAGRFLYCIPFSYKAILKIDMDSCGLEYIRMKEMETTYINDTTRIGNKILAVYSNTNDISIFDMDAETVIYKKAGKEGRKFTSAANIHDRVYMFDVHTREIVAFSMDRFTEEKQVYKTSYNALKLTSVFYDMIIVDPVDNSEMKILDSQGKPLFQTKRQQKFKSDSLCSAYYSGIACDNFTGPEISYYFSRSSYVMYQIRGGREVKEFTLTLGDAEFSKLRKMFSDAQDLQCSENDICGLDSWVADLEKRKPPILPEEEECSRKILKEIKRLYDIC